MANLKFKTKGGANPQGKPRVYFTCHPEDFERAFDKFCEDIFKTHDCAIYYTEDMNAEIPEADKATDLERMNLFVIPVTFRLLSTPNRAMDSDFRYAIEKHIPVLPIMLETGIDEFYSRKDKFGELQYLNLYSNDLTEISYEEKLKKFLESVLISDEMAEKVRAAFDAYIFLSYRKKDRRYANDLMRIIHSNPICRDIAIWYDEFLTPGENFNDAIGKALEKSELFTLLVTPNLINEENYVRTTEYPAARKAGKDILPAEMEATDSTELQKQFENIPECVNVYDEEAFRSRLLESAKRLAKEGNGKNPEHNFLIGLAYLDGIDVEVDRARALELITSAAEAELPEAMEKLADMYYDAIGVERDYREALKWRKRNADYYIREYGEGYPETLTALHNLAIAYSEVGDYKKALELYDKVYVLRCNVLGEKHPDTLTTLNNLAFNYGELGDYKKALELYDKVYVLRCNVLGEKHPDTLTTLNNLAASYLKLGDNIKARELMEKVYTIQCRMLGEEHPDTLITLDNLASAYLTTVFGDLGNDSKALELKEKAYALSRKVLGEEHPATLEILGGMAIAYGNLGDYKKTLELTEKAYELLCKVLGEDHPNMAKFLSSLAWANWGLGNYEKALELYEKIYTLRCKVLGEEHPDTLRSLNNLAAAYGNLGVYSMGLELTEKAYEIRRKTLGEGHPDTLMSLDTLAGAYFDLKEYPKAFELFWKIYEIQCNTNGEDSFPAWSTLCAIAVKYNSIGNNKAIEICDYILERRPGLIAPMIESMAMIYEQNGFAHKAAFLRQIIS